MRAGLLPSQRSGPGGRAWLHAPSGPLPLAKRCPLARYTCGLEGQLALPASGDDASPGISLPASLPFPVDPARGPPLSRRRRRRWSIVARARGWVNQLVSLYNFIELGFPKSAKDYGYVRGCMPLAVGLAARAASTARVIKRFGRLAYPADGAGGGRSESLAGAFAQGSQGYSGGHLAVKKAVTVAEHARLDDVALPEAAGLVRPANQLQPERAAVLRDMRRLVLTDVDVRGPVSLGCFEVEPAEQKTLFSQLLACGAAVLLPSSQVATLRGRAVV